MLKFIVVKDSVTERDLVDTACYTTLQCTVVTHQRYSVITTYTHPC